MLSSTELKNLPDASLDAEYAHAFDARNAFYASTVESEIIDRLSGIGGFLGGVVGYTRFPLYDARGHFHQVGSAQGSVKDSAGNVGAGLSSFAGSLGVGIFKGIWPLILLAAVIAGVVFMVKFKKG